MANLNLIQANHLGSVLKEIKYYYKNSNLIKPLFKYNEFLDFINGLYNHAEAAISNILELNHKCEYKVHRGIIKGYESYTNILGELIVHQLKFVQHNSKIVFTTVDYSIFKADMLALLINMHNILNGEIKDNGDDDE